MPFCCCMSIRNPGSSPANDSSLVQITIINRTRSPALRPLPRRGSAGRLSVRSQASDQALFTGLLSTRPHWGRFTGAEVRANHRTSWRWPGKRRIPWLTLGTIAAGGATGALARWGLDEVFPHAAGTFDWTTLGINVAGCGLIGVLMVAITEVWHAHRLTGPFLGVGVLGGFTTFSGYIVDIQESVTAGEPQAALVYMMKPASSEARKLTAWAMSPGAPIRPAGTEAIGLSDFGGDVGVALDGDEARCDRVHCDAGRGELARPAAGQAYLCAPGRGMRRPARRRLAGDLGVDVHDAAVAPGLRPGQHRTPSSTELLTKKFSWASWPAQATSVTAASGCGPVALSTSTSTGPKRPAIAATSSATCCWLVTSAQNASAARPSSPMLRATCSACRSPRGTLTATARPSCARRRAIAALRPRELPVTQATHDA